MISVPDWYLTTPRVIAAMSSAWSAVGIFRSATASSNVASATGAGTTAVYIPFVVTTPRTFARGWWQNGSVPAGSACVGIYSEAGVQLATTGNVVASGASVVQSAAFGAAVTLLPGRYYMAFSMSSSAANQIFGVSTALAWKIAGAYIQSAANPLPSTATFAVWATTVLSQFGISADSFV